MKRGEVPLKEGEGQRQQEQERAKAEQAVDGSIKLLPATCGGKEEPWAQGGAPWACSRHCRDASEGPDPASPFPLDTSGHHRGWLR